MEHYYALILAGGGGTRMWPLSRQNMPKQMLPLIGEHSMFKTSIDRLAPLFPPERIYISTAQKYVADLQAEAPEIPAENFVVEPAPRNNAPAVGLAMTIIQQRDPEAVVAMLTSDHHISQTEKFREILSAACEVAQDGSIVTLGISPSIPSTGFGYIQQGERQDEIRGYEYYRAERFTEKPDLVRATQFVASGNYSWNSGMFIWKAQVAMQEFERQQPAMYALLEKLQNADDFDATLNAIWDEMPRLSIDYAVMEDAEDMVVFPVDIGWSDVGTWASLHNILPQDKFGNAGRGSSDNRIVLDATNTLLFTEKLAVAIGVDNILVIETEDAIMICDKERSQDVREIVNYLKENDMTDYV